MRNVVLLVDDEADFNRYCKTCLESTGVEVVTETDGDRVFNLVNNIKPDIVVLDIDLKLDNVDGRIICSRLCELPEYRNREMDVILISGHYRSPADEIAGFKLGANNYLIKPFEMAKLETLINSLLKRRQYTAAAEIKVDERLSIDLSRRSILLGGVEVNFTALEFDVLAYLAQPPNKIRTKFELLEKVWQKQHIEEGAIAKCIHMIRKKIARKKSKSYIKTVFGVGYLLHAED